MTFTMLEVLLGCGANNGTRDGMREVLFQARREAKDLGPVPPIKRDDAFHLGLRFGKRASLVEDDRIGLGESPRNDFDPFTVKPCLGSSGS